MIKEKDLNELIAHIKEKYMLSSPNAGSYRKLAVNSCAQSIYAIYVNKDHSYPDIISTYQDHARRFIYRRVGPEHDAYQVKDVMDNRACKNKTNEELTVGKLERCFKAFMDEFRKEI